ETVARYLDGRGNEEERQAAMAEQPRRARRACPRRQQIESSTAKGDRRAAIRIDANLRGRPAFEPCFRYSPFQPQQRRGKSQEPREAPRPEPGDRRRSIAIHAIARPERLERALDQPIDFELRDPHQERKQGKAQSSASDRPSSSISGAPWNRVMRV